MSNTDQIFTVITNFLKLKKIDKSAKLSSHFTLDLELDSIDFMELINHLEKEYNIITTDEDFITPPENVQDMIKFIQHKTSKSK